MKLDKTQILNEIKSHYGFKSDAEFARFLGIKPNTLANWYARNTLDYEVVFTKCVGINGNWLLGGCGDMMQRYNVVTDKFVFSHNPAVVDFPFDDLESLRIKYTALLEEYNKLLKEKLKSI